MMLASCGFVGLFVLRLIQRHGWEYVPIVLLAYATSWYLGNPQLAGPEDGVFLTAIAGVHLVTRKDTIADSLM